jgi:hypothetical protein
VHNGQLSIPGNFIPGKFCCANDRLVVQNYALARRAIDYRQYADSTGGFYYLADRTGCTDGEKAIMFAC